MATLNEKASREMRALPAVALAAGLLFTLAAKAQTSLRFFGNGVAAPDLDRVKIALDAPARPVDVGAGSFTVEFWLRALPGENNSTFACVGDSDNWINGNIVLDRDVFGPGDHGDWGVSIDSDGFLMFGVHNGTDGATTCGRTNIEDGLWHHVALSRRPSDGLFSLWVDGVPESSTFGPLGDISYRNGRSGAPNDPFLVIGAEKHDAGPAYPSFSGWIDELRVSTVARYAGTFLPPSQPFLTDASTAAIYHFDEAAGTVLGDVSGAPGGPSSGVLHVGGTPAGPLWSTDTPFALIFADGFETGDTSAWTATVP